LIWITATGSIKTIPIAIVTILGAMKRNETIVIHHRLHVFNCVRKYPQKATPSEAIPSIAPKSLAANLNQIKPLATNSNAGE
jgi:hypothetical protein